MVDAILVETDRGAYRRAVGILKQAYAAAQAAGQTDAFAANVARPARSPSPPTDVHIIATLDKAKLTDT